MRILGLNSVYHESSAAVVVNGRLIAAAEEERFNRRKHGSQARVDNADELPWSAISYCLGEAGLSAEDLDSVCYAFDPQLRREKFAPDPYADAGDWGDPDGEATFLASVMRVPETLSADLGTDLTGRFRWVPHHEAHAASAYFPSGFPSADVIVIDGIGEHVTALLGHWDRAGLEVLHRFTFPDSVGFLWEKVSNFLGFGEYDACKVMSLAAYGDRTACAGELGKLATTTVDGFSVNADIAQFRRKDTQGRKDFQELSRLLGPPQSMNWQRRADVAAALQDATDEIMLTLARRVHEIRPSQALCLAGGVALNCHTNWILLQQGPFERIYIPSAPHDAGTAVGAALVQAAQAPNVILDAPALRDAYVGPQFGDAEVLACLRRCGLEPQRPHDIAAVAAELIVDGRVVAWFQGRMEFGPRALGNRSLLADPRDPRSREILNSKVKHRESFRPFAPSVLAEHAAGWFDLSRASDSYAYMLFACPAHAERAPFVPAVIHIDGTSRVQLVTREVNPLFHRLISHFHARTGIPMVLNTSFNDSEPIVCTPDDAINTFLATRIDALVLGNYLVCRE
jgi:carbamoyltransferase